MCPIILIFKFRSDYSMRVYSFNAMQNRLYSRITVKLYEHSASKNFII